MSDQLFPGSGLCRHNSSVRSWKDLEGDDFVIIGGYESGMDVQTYIWTSNLASCGKRCTVVSSTAFWRVTTPDPSTELAPYTAERVRKACSSATPPQLLAPLRVYAVEALADDKDSSGGGYIVRGRFGPPIQYARAAGDLRSPVQPSTLNDIEQFRQGVGLEGTEISLKTPQAPLLCTGFEGSVVLGVVKELFDWSNAGKEVADGHENDEPQGAKGCAAGSPLLNEHDESTTTPGLFLVGPAVRHGELSFCFVYKFRQRFGVVAEAIAKELGRDTKRAVNECRTNNMFLDDFQCCEGVCGDTC